MNLDGRRQIVAVVIMVSVITWLFSLGLLGWVYEGWATGYAGYACASASPDIRPSQCDTNQTLNNDAFVIWGASWFLLAVGVLLYYDLPKGASGSRWKNG